MDIGPGELVIVLVAVLVMFGGARLPELARSLGQAHTELRRGLRDGERDDAPGDDRPRPPTPGGDDAR
jgi:sec-independent protein translocase protein TatA